MSDLDTTNTEAEATTEKATKAKPSFGLQIVGAALPAQESAKRGGAGRGPDMRISKLLTELAEIDPRNEAGEAEWALLVTYTTASGARETFKAIEAGERPVPEGLAFEYDVRRWDAEVEGETRRVSGLFAKFIGASEDTPMADAPVADAPVENEVAADSTSEVEGEFDEAGFPV